MGFSLTSYRPRADFTRASRPPLPPWLFISLVSVALGLVLGVLVVAVTPVYVIAGLVGLVVVAAMLTDIRYGMVGFVAVATLLPFATIPVSLGVLKLTLIDVCVMAVILVWLMRLLADRREALRSSGIDLQVLLFLGVCVTSFVLGTAYQITSSDARLFVKLLLSIVLFFAVVNCVRDLRTMRMLIVCLSVGGALAGIVGIGLYLLPAPTATRLLASLSRLDYPASNILQYDANSHVLKAIGTSIDHNILGATLMMCGVLTVSLLIRPQALARRMWWLATLGVTLLALLLTYSRGSLFGFLVGCAIVATLRFRRLWLVLLLLIPAVVLFPELARSSFVTHVQTGLAIQDQATQMRFGEYKDALRLIQAFPVFGVGFSAAPDVDLYLGVSSIYLLLAENVGLVGLAVWLWTIATVTLRATRQFLNQSVTASASRGSRFALAGAAGPPTEASTLAVGCLGALAAALVGGLFDHHFVDMHFPHVVGMVWMIVGLLVVGMQLDRASRGSTNQAA